MAGPTGSGKAGDIEFVGGVLWICRGGKKWVRDIPTETGTLSRQAALRDIEK